VVIRSRIPQFQLPKHASQNMIPQRSAMDVASVEFSSSRFSTARPSHVHRGKNNHFFNDIVNPLDSECWHADCLTPVVR
jgi:hypothetical protein